MRENKMTLAIMQVREDILNHCYDQYTDDESEVVQAEITQYLNPALWIYFLILNKVK
jgi:hypothetical protein